MSLSRSQSSLLFFSLLTVAIGQSLVFALLAPLGREVKLSEVQITSIIAISAAIYGWISPAWGRFSDHRGRKPVLLIGLTGFTVGIVLFTSVFQAGLLGLLAGLPLYILAILTRCMQSSIMAATPPACSAYAADLTLPEQRMGAMAQLGAANSLGTILGPAVSGALATLGLLAPLYFAGLLTAIAGLLVWWRLPAIPAVARKSHAPRTRLRYRDPRIFRFIAAAVVMFSGFGAIQQTLGFTIQDRLHLSGVATAQYTGGAFMVAAIASFFAQGIVLQRVKLPPEQFVLAGLGCMLLSAGFIASFQETGYLLVGMAFIGLGTGLALPSISAAASMAVSPEEQGAVAGLVASSPAIGFVAGPVIGGLLYQQDSSYPSVFSGAVFVLVFIQLILSRRRL
ncbi:MAG: MFS transporter [Pseudomonadota bacterium]